MTTRLECNFSGKKLIFEINKVAKQANGSVLAQWGETVVLVTALMSAEPREGQDFFPLTVDYQEKFYAAGRIPGGFFKREAKPSSKATLTARLIDRPLRPLFPQGFFNDVHIVANPGPELQKKSDIEILVSGSKHAVTMVEGGAKIVSEEDILEAILFAHREMQSLIQWQEELKKQYGIKKAEFTPPKENTALKESVEKLCVSEFSKIVHLPGKSERSEKLIQLKKEVVEKLLATVSEEEKEAKKEEIKNFFDLHKEHYSRSYTLKNKKRIDDRSYATIRPITIEVGLL